MVVVGSTVVVVDAVVELVEVVVELADVVEVEERVEDEGTLELTTATTVVESTLWVAEVVPCIVEISVVLLVPELEFDILANCFWLVI